MSARSLNWLKFGGLVALAFALGLLFAGLLDLPNRSSAQEQGRSASGHRSRSRRRRFPRLARCQELSEAFAAVAEHVKPSVVYIRSQRTEHANTQRIPPGMERFFPRFRQATGNRAGQRLRVHRLGRRLHPHQQSRGRRCRAGDRPSARPPGVHRQGGRHRSQYGRRGREDRREQPPAGRARQQR